VHGVEGSEEEEEEGSSLTEGGGIPQVHAAQQVHVDKAIEPRENKPTPHPQWS
jgi:hypothetical protein